VGRKEAGSGPPVNVGPAVAGPAHLPAGAGEPGAPDRTHFFKGDVGPTFFPVPRAAPRSARPRRLFTSTVTTSWGSRH